MSAIYAIANQKGGVGKTTTCLCLGAALAETEKRVLLVDLDPQAGLTTSLGFDPDKFETTIYAALIDPEVVSLPEITVKTRVPNLWLVPSNLDLAGAEAELIGEIGWDRNLKELLSTIASLYDFIIVDCPPSLGVLTTNALMAADSVIVPVQTEYLALRGLKQLSKIISKVKKKGNPNLQVRILRTMHDARTLHAREIGEEIERVFSGQLYQTVIKRTVKFADASLAGEPILSYAKNSPGAMAYRELAKEILNDAKTHS
ncbi:MAG: ParA family protein [Candidatus Methanomethyliaceae archaeon]